MINNDSILIKYGLTPFFLQQIQDNEIIYLARLIAIHKKYYQAINIQGDIVKAISKGELLHHRAKNNAELPQIGDFVILQEGSYNNIEQKDLFYIKIILNRKTIFRRKILGKKQDMQILATNIDYIFIVMSLDSQFSFKRLERFLVASFDSEVTPVVILTKSDLKPNNAKEINLIKNNFPDIAMLITTINQPESFEPIKNFLADNKTGVLVGVSGSGKSTITNFLLQEDVQKIGEVSKERNKGKHTTTHREIFLLKSGGCIIDSPGIKEFGLYLANEYNMNETFTDIILASTQCKFRNCSHKHEPDCNVLAQVKSGKISKEHFEHYMHLLEEQEEKSKQYNKKTK